MKLSVIIRLGGMVVQEQHGYYLEFNQEGVPCGCLIGTACYALGYREPSQTNRRAITAFIKEQFPLVAQFDATPCPACGQLFSGPAVKQVPGWHLEHLFEAHMWSREDIARYVENLEMQLAPKEERDVVAVQA